jgi:hypothetical protein
MSWDEELFLTRASKEIGKGRGEYPRQHRCASLTTGTILKKVFGVAVLK